MRYMVELNNVTKRIGNNLILKDVNLKLEKGKIYGLIGANGSGKSTLLKIILGLMKSSGEVYINGFNLKKNYKSALKDISGIVDFVSFYDFLTAYENVRYFALLLDVPLKRVDEVMDMVGLSKDDKKLVKKFSLGMKQRLGIAISLLKDPSILILDEPTNGLDPRGIYDFRQMLLKFKDKTIIVSSHIISEIEKIVDEVIFINNSVVYQKGIDETDKKCINFRVGDYDSSMVNPKELSLCEGKSVYMSDREVAQSIKSLVNNDIPIYRVQEENTLENMLLSMLEEDKND